MFVNNLMLSKEKLITVTPKVTIGSALEIMDKNRFLSIPVVENNKVVGIVSLGDIATDAKYDTEVADTLIDISKPNKSNK